jgi:peptidoglycan/xylan/chitin deacetylase (PgdA/CDA1 family)
MFQKFLNRIRRIRQQKAAILMYHQVCERKTDPWELAVHPDHFGEQLNYLKKNFTVVSMEVLAKKLADNSVQPRTIGITFDDGFRDNYTNAAPLLDWHDLPATFYVATTGLQDQKIYWWDELQDIVFHTETLPPVFAMEINNESVRYEFKRDHVLHQKLMNQIRAWNYNLPIPNERIALYMLLWQRIRPLAYTLQNKVLSEIKGWAGKRRDDSAQGTTMSVHEMQMLSQNPLFSIGAHSVHHAMLAEQNDRDQAFEVQECKRQLENWLGKPVDGFAYPYGNYNNVTQTIIKEAGFKYAVSTESKLVTPQDDQYALPRVQVKNWCVYEFASKINEMVN